MKKYIVINKAHTAIFIDFMESFNGQPLHLYGSPKGNKPYIFDNKSHAVNTANNIGSDWTIEEL
jgi:hypothetical protein